VTPLGMELGGSDIQADVPTISLTDDSGEQDPGPRDDHPLPGCRVELFDWPQEPAQSPCVVVHRSNPDHGTVTDGSVCRVASASTTNRRLWLSAKRDAPAWRASIVACLEVGASANRNVVCRMASKRSL
jgi:hypothetical protein